MTRFWFPMMLSLCAATAAAAPTSCNVDLELAQHCTVSIGGMAVTISRGGEVTSSNGTARLMLPPGFHVDSFVWGGHDDTTIFVLRLSDTDVGASLIARLDLRAVRVVWRTELEAFNASDPLVTESSVYLGALGSVVKLSIKDGAVVWQHDGLYEPATRSYASFVQPRQEGDAVVFREQKFSTADSRQVREVRVDDSSGKLLSN